MRPALAPKVAVVEEDMAVAEVVAEVAKVVLEEDTAVTEVAKVVAEEGEAATDEAKGWPQHFTGQA